MPPLPADADVQLDFQTCEAPTAGVGPSGTLCTLARLERGRRRVGQNADGCVVHDQLLRLLVESLARGRIEGGSRLLQQPVHIRIVVV